MLNFRPLTFLDSFDLSCSLRPRMGQFSAVGDGQRLMHLRYPRKGTDADAEDFLAARETARWPEFKTLLGRIKRLGAQAFGQDIVFGCIYLDMLDAGSCLPWRRESGAYCERFWRLHLPLRTNPATMLYGGIEMFNPLPGQLLQVNPRAWSSAVNLGDHARVHLVIDCRGEEKLGLAAEGE